MMLLEKLRQRMDCRKNGHGWKYASTVFDCDHGYGGGREMYRYECAKCGKSRITCWPDGPVEKAMEVNNDYA